MFSTSDTIVAIATPPGRGGIGVVRLSGADARANFDVQVHCQLEPGDVVSVSAAAKPATLLHPKGYSYFSMLRQKLRWNERTA